MAIHFYDTSALVKRFFVETGSKRVDALLNDAAITHVISPLTRTEVHSAIMRRAHANAVADLTRRFEQDVETVFGSVIVDDALFDEAVVLVRQHRLRGCDSLQLASALRLRQALQTMNELDAVIFVCADADLNGAAAAEGLAVINLGDA